MARFEINDKHVLTHIYLEQGETEVVVPDGVIELEKLFPKV